ncbi:MAG: segregation/condensation protein A [Clostridia bacterium]|nr:segregation/condensation protein A [Clostridia bacterium]
MEQYTIKMDNFEGPLDLLCHLIDKNKMDIFDIKINDITDQYIEYLSYMKQMNLEITSEFIVMASRLLYLKSKHLLPVLEEEEEEDEFDLVKLLIEYKKYKEITKVFKENLNTFGKRCYKLPEKIELPKNKLDKVFDASTIIDTYANFVRKEIEKKNLDAENINRIAVSEKYTIQSKIREILKTLWKKPQFIFNKLFNVKKKPKAEVVTAFLSLLELSKLERIKVTQNSLFGDISVTKIQKVKS